MPELSRVKGMIIQMYYGDHPPPHIHVFYAGQKAKIDLDGNLIAGNLPVNMLRILRKWIIIDKESLLEKWGNLQLDLPIKL